LLGGGSTGAGASDSITFALGGLLGGAVDSLAGPAHIWEMDLAEVLRRFEAEYKCATAQTAAQKPTESMQLRTIRIWVSCLSIINHALLHLQRLTTFRDQTANSLAGSVNLSISLPTPRRLPMPEVLWLWDLEAALLQD